MKTEILKIQENPNEKRSYNQIKADLELARWNTSKIPVSFSHTTPPHNNRKRTRGRVIQTVGNKQIKHFAN